MSRSKQSAARQCESVRDDPSGELRNTLRTLIADGTDLSLMLATAGEKISRRELGRIERWGKACVRAVSAGFEAEAAAEMFRATAPPGAQGGKAAAERRRLLDALALLEALEATLGARRGGREAGRARGWA